ncbi:hypothetical protein DPMN_132866 [Dreissena polymorpha]|uniref:Uncharacterized protein n=1 Tax=Dreissena polymorpha TaxID=45954 RepID=A0A9D4FSF7_DREPO|nr:hypothetical protein DPMN_132866 [Dreissena polymorpha]
MAESTAQVISRRGRSRSVPGLEVVVKCPSRVRVAEFGANILMDVRTNQYPS